jgi:hypothetical protein
MPQKDYRSHAHFAGMRAQEAWLNYEYIVIVGEKIANRDK